MIAPTSRPMTITEWGMLLALSVLWGGSFFFNGVLVRELPPLTTVAGRVVVAAVVLLLVLRIARITLPVDRRTWTALFGMGLLNNVVPFCLIVWGQTQIASGLASILNATTPLFTVIVAHVLTRDEKLNGFKIAGVVLGLVGVAVMLGADVLSGLGANVWAQLACTAAAISYALAGIYGRRFKAMGLDPVATATGQVTASALMLLPVALLIDQPWTLGAPSGAAWAALFGLAALSTALAYVLFFRVLSSAGATNVLLVTFLVPVSAIVLGTFVLGERLEPEHLAGMALISLGLAAIDGRIRNLFGLRRAVRPAEPATFQGRDI